MSEPLSNSALARELHRRQVLGLLGVSPLVSRFDPPGAAPAERLILTNPAAAEPVAPAPPPPVTRPSEIPDEPPPAAVSPAAAAQLPARPPERGAPEVASAELAERVRGAAVAFSLVMVTAGDVLWVEALEDGLLQDAQLQLVAAMTRALGRGDGAVSHRRFDWPLPGNLNMPADIDSARQSVAALVARLMDESGADTLVAMGDAALPPLQAVAAVPKSIPATRAMLIDPSLKREAWRHLVGLRG